MAAKRWIFWCVFLSVTSLLLSATFQANRLWLWLNPEPRPLDLIEVSPRTESSAKPKLMRLPKVANRQTLTPQGTGLGWPTLLGAAHDCTSAETGLELLWGEEGPWEKWRVSVGTGYASPVALGDTVVLLQRKEARELVECFDAETGQSRWEFSWPATYECPYAHSSGPYSAPVLEQGCVYALGAAGQLYCLRLDNGSVLWHRDLHEEYGVEIEVWPVSASPLIEGNRLIVNLGGRKSGAGVIALDKATGKTLWTATNDGASCSTPRAATIHNRRYLFVWTAEALVSLDPEVGKVYWRIPFAAKNHEAAHGTTPLIAGDIVLVSGYQLGNLCVRVLPDGTYQELWRDKRKLLDSQYNNLLYFGGCVCGYSSTRRRLRCLELTTGELKWEWRSREPNGTIISVDGGYLLFGEKGRLGSLSLTPEGATIRSMTERPVLASPCLSYPALNNGLLYLRNEEEMVCIDLRRSASAKASPTRAFHESPSPDDLRNP